MSEAPNRDELIELLQSLGSDQDEELLAAARKLHTLVEDAGADWDDLLVADIAEDRPEEAAEPTVEPTVEPSDINAESLALIEKLLAKPGISDDFREELNGYKTDIAAGEFDDSDRRYIRALHKRLML